MQTIKEFSFITWWLMVLATIIVVGITICLTVASVSMYKASPCKPLTYQQYQQLLEQSNYYDALEPSPSNSYPISIQYQDPLEDFSL